MSLRAEVRHALRSLRVTPAYSAAVVVTLGLGIGANVTMFGLVTRLMLSAPPHIAQPGRVVHLGITLRPAPGQQFTMTTTSYPVFTDIRDQSPSFASVAAASGAPMIYGSGVDAQSIAGVKASGSFFALLGVHPFLGRLFGEPEDAAPGGTPVAVLSHAFWKRAGADRGIVGRIIRLDGNSYTVIGVAPPDFNGDQFEPVDVWVPLRAGLQGQPGWEAERYLNIVSIVGRLRDGVSANRAAAEATSAFRRGGVAYRAVDTTARIDLSPIVPGKGTSPLSTQSRVALWLAAMSAIVFVVAVANVAILVLVRNIRRRRELAVRLALGASRWRLVRQLTIEALLLAGLGGALALLVAGWASEGVRAFVMPGMSATSHFVPLRTLWIAIGATSVAVLLTGLLPAIRASRASLVGDLKEGAGAIGRHRSRTLAALLVGQVSLSVILLVGAGLFVLSLHRVETQDLGFSAKHVWLASMKFTTPQAGLAKDQLYRAAEAQLRRRPGVLATSLVQATPFEGGFNVPPIAVPGRDDFPLPNQQLPALAVATPTYFNVLGMRVLSGRNFDASDGPGSPLVMIINDAMARTLWPGQSALGKCIRIGFGDGPPSGPVASPSAPCRQVVGVVNTARRRSIREETSEQARMQYYVPFGQLPKPGGPVVHDNGEVWGILVRTSGAPGVAGMIRQSVQSTAADAPFTEVRSLQGLLDRQIQPWAMGAAMFTGFGLLVLVLSVFGSYSVRAYSVAQRRREMAVRVALGARGADLIRMIVGEGVRIAAFGIGAGILLAVLGAPVIEPLLFNVSARDPMVLAIAGSVLLLVALLASAVPALRASGETTGRALQAD